MKIKTTKGEFVQLVNSLFSLKDLQGKEFAIVAAENLELITKELKDVEEAGKPSKEFMDLAMSVNAFTSDPEEKDSKIYEIEKLEKDNKELIDERRDQLDAVAELLKDELEIEVKPITYEMLPDIITAQQIASISKFIK